jgi:hypothetical protein
MKRLGLILLLTGPVLADGGITVQLPDAGKIVVAASPEFLTELVVANVVGMNCPAFAIDQGEWTLITGTADKVAEILKVANASDYDDKYYTPAFALLDKPDTCSVEGPKIKPLIDRLKEMGGDTKPIG